jgi:hypothetical protein
MRLCSGRSVNPELVTGVRPHDGQAQRAGQLIRAARVVNVRVGQPDLFQRQTESLDLGQQARQVATRIDYGGLHRFVAPHDGTVLGKRGHGNGVVLQHGERADGRCG